MASDRLGVMHPVNLRAAALDSLAHGSSVSRVARDLGVARSTVRAWRERPDPVIVGPPCARCLGASPWPASAYAALLGFYLGDGCLSTHRNKVVFRVACDATYPRIVDDVSALMSAFAIDRSIFHVPAPGTTVVQTGWKHWLCLFPQHGPGRKHERRIALEPWQQEIVDAHPAEFLRGLFHSDACRSRNWATKVVGGERKRYDYPRWEFSNRSEDILALCGATLDTLGIDWRRSSRVHLSVSRRDAVAALDAAIGLKA